MAKSLDDLKRLIQTCPVIDNHGHNLLRRQHTGNLLTITSEASGDALEDTPTSLAHIRAARQLRQLYDLPPDTDWPTILEKRSELLNQDADAFHRKCFAGTQTILIDDGLANADTVQPYSWHDQYTLSPCKRIVRIETVAADLLRTLHQQNKLPIGVAVADEEACGLAWLTFITAFEQAIAAAVQDPDVVGFKSVICYRTGLDVRVGKDLDISEDGLRSFRRHFLPDCVGRDFRVESKGMNDALVISTCKLIAAGYRQQDIAKPLQFHTGLGDNDISLLDSNPACLQPLIKEFPTVPIVLLHSSYPYTREAGYLATVYKNCYLDIGEVFPMVSRDGQENVVRHALELTPWSKLLWSTDGHFYPETFWLANVQGREVLQTVFCAYVEAGDLTVSDAMRAVEGILFGNSNLLYGLELEIELEADDALKNAQTSAPTTALLPLSASRYNSAHEQVYTPFIDEHYRTDFIFVQWLDYMGLLRTRCLPVAEFDKLLRFDSTIHISTGNLGTLQNDHMTGVCNPVGFVCVEPDLTLASLRPMRRYKAKSNAASVMARFTDRERKPLPLCPRAQLGEVVAAFKEYDVDLLVGFEIEVTFCDRNKPTSDAEADPFSPLDTNHAWGTLTDEQHTFAFDFMLIITDALADMGIEVQQLHSEAGAGQYEFVLPPLPPVLAVDTLIQARQCIQQMAAGKNLRATCHPQPFPGIGTAAHAHISFNRNISSPPDAPSHDLTTLQDSFIAALLSHLPALCAITMPQAISYKRVVDDSWTGGTWIAWGTENREVPVRKVDAGDASRWEIRCLDGCANMYLALVALLSTGLHGIRSNLELTMQDCTVNPTALSDTQKQGLGISERMPTSLEQALEAAGKDEAVRDAMPEGMLEHYLVMKRAEQEMLNLMSEQERRVWLMERY